MRYKITYNNFQYYEDEAIIAYLEKQREMGWVLQRTFGMLGEVWLFSRSDENCTAKEKYILYQKHLTPVVDDEIGRLQKLGTHILIQNRQYVIFKVSAEEKEQSKAHTGNSRMDKRMVSVKKAFVKAMFMLILAFAASIMSAWHAWNATEPLAVARLVLSLLILGCFLLCFAGDCYDYKKGWYAGNQGLFYVTDRSPVKKSLFQTSDAVRMGVFVASAIFSVMQLCAGADAVVMLELVRLWLVFSVVYVVANIRYQKCYIIWLFLSILLVTV